ncbi:MAG: YesL family protein [Lachnospiraceae bacterium]|nr:YesL family protein [Lachnospiraceae bacterium]
MDTIFNVDNIVWWTLSKLGDLMFLNFLFMLCCIPIFTAGASLTALSYVTLAMHDGQDGYIARRFFKSFRQNFKQATCIWIPMLLIGVALVADLLILRRSEGTMVMPLTICIVVFIVVYLMVFFYMFALLAKFETTVKDNVANAFRLVISNIPQTLSMFVVCAGAVILPLINSTTLMWGMLIWLLCGSSLLSYYNTLFLGRIFKKYIPEDEEEEKDPDKWNLDETMPKEEK